MEFSPLNSLEVSLLAVKSGEINMHDFIGKLIRSNLALPTASEVKGDGSGFEPIIFDREGVKMISAFTDIYRAKSLVHLAPFCLEINGKDVLNRIPTGCGLVVNPGFKVGFELSSDGITNILEDIEDF